MTVLSVMPGQVPERMVLEETLEAMQNFVGGTIQAIYPFDDAVAIICNDNAKLLGLPYNRVLRDDVGNVYDILCFFRCALRNLRFIAGHKNIILFTFISCLISGQ